MKRKTHRLLSLALCIAIIASVMAIAPVTAHASVITLHAWFSDSGMGEEAHDYTVRNTYYLCYELLDEDGRRIDQTGSHTYKVAERIYDEFGETHEETEYNNDNNWLRFTPYRACRYYGTVTVSGYVGITVDLDFYADYRAQFSASPSSLSLDVDGNNEAELRFIPSGSYPGYYSVGWDHDRSMLDISFKEWEGDTAVLTVKGLQKGTTTITCSINEKYSGNDELLAEVKVPVRVYSSKYTDVDFSLTSTNNVDAKQEVALEINGINHIEGYYWGTNPSYRYNSYINVESVYLNNQIYYTDRWQNVTQAGTYYATLKFSDGTISGTESITFVNNVFNPNGGTVTPQNVVSEKGRSYAPPTPQREDYTFLGWEDANGNTLPSTFTFNTSATYKAKWKAIPRNCEERGEPHQWGENPTAVHPATCTESGYEEYVCEKCGETQTVILNATGHTRVIDPAKPATCTETGLTEGAHCSACSEVLQAQTVIPAKGHSAVIDPGVPPTCTETGLTEGAHCSVCGETITAQNEIPAKGHTLVTDRGVPATCTESGLTDGSHCTVCRLIIDEREVIPATGHDYQVVPGRSPTLDEEGLTDGVQCTHCGDWLLAQRSIPKLLLGDVNADGVVNIDDATLIQKFIAELAELTDEQQRAADVNKDGSVDINDVTLIQKYTAEMIGAF